MSFLSDYFEVVEGAKESPVCCPFDHFTASGTPYKESNPSAHINTEDKLFHCKVCGTGYNEMQFIHKVFECSLLDARRIQTLFQNEETQIRWTEETQLSEEDRALAQRLGIAQEVMQELQLATPGISTGQLAFPVFMFGHLVDVRIYNPENKPKVRSRTGSVAGLVLPFDIWRTTPEGRTTLICAGEKDMALARTHGFNAITLTGGENVLPKLKPYFKDRNIAIVYDNDGAGIRGARRLAAFLTDIANDVKVCTAFHEVCVEKGEDITDYFTKYGKTRRDLIECLKATPTYIPQPEDYQTPAPIMDLLQASKPENIGRLVRSNIQIVANAETTFVTPAGVYAEKFQRSPPNLRPPDVMKLGECRDWELSEETLADMLHLMDNNFTEGQIKENLKNLLHIPQKERYVRLKILNRRTVFKGHVTDMFETSTDNHQAMEYTAYSLDQKFESGKKYMATYKLVPHPYKGQHLVMLIHQLVEANDSVSNFKITPQVKEALRPFQQLEGTALERLDQIAEKFKGLLGYDGNNTLIQALELAYHTVLVFHFGSVRDNRGYLDTLVVGESRVGKSSTADAMRKAYGLGVFTSLAGNSATIPGLVGGSNKTATGYQTRAGVIPQNHKGLIIFEEFGKSHNNVVAELTDIRSSNEVRITRVSGTLTMPAMVRMIALSNVKHKDGNSRPIASYPNGISIIQELVDSAEDIARYDLMMVLSDKGAHRINPFWRPAEPFPEESYKTRVRWVWSRKPEDIIIDEAVGLYILDKANHLNSLYECHLKIFGTEAWKKLTRLALAVAGTLVSTDETYAKLILTTEHVDAAVSFFQRIYDNDSFRLREYAEHERRYSHIDAEGVAALQAVYDRYPSLIQVLQQHARANKQMLNGATGLGTEELNRALNQLTRGLFIQFVGFDIVPTERYRKGLAQLNWGTQIPRIGEL